MLKLTNVTKSFGDIKAIEDISFEVEDGEFVFLTGPSGSGKTTVLNLIIGKYAPDSGTVLFDGQDVGKISSSKIHELRQKIGVVFQDFKVLPERTVAENIEVALAVINAPKSTWNERIGGVLKSVGLESRSMLFPGQLSGGEVQRLALARALVVNPKMIIADEPTGNLDWETADLIMDLFEKINKEGKTVLIATHHKGIIDRMKKKVIHLAKGKLAKK